VTNHQAARGAPIQAIGLEESFELALPPNPSYW